MEEHGHLVAFCFGLPGFSPVSILRVARTSLDSSRLARAVITTDGHAVSGWVAAPVTAALALC